MMNILIAVLTFLAIVSLIEGIYGVWRILNNPERNKVKRRIEAISSEVYELYGGEAVQIVRKRTLSEIPWLDQLLALLPGIGKIDRLVEQAHTEHPLGFFFLLSLFLAFLGLYSGSVFMRHIVLGVAGAAILGATPYLYLTHKKHKRMCKFERQLPDALDLLARSLRAGHAFSAGLQTVADEFPDPVGTEFGKTFHEINLGVGVPDALKNLVNRVDVSDLKFFVTSVIVQRETGGNLSEILENLSHLIRERFRLAGHVKALTAEVRFSAIILGILPFVMAFLLFLISPDYMKTLVEDPIGPVLIGVTLFMMFLGIMALKQITKIRY